MGRASGRRRRGLGTVFAGAIADAVAVIVVVVAAAAVAAAGGIASEAVPWPGFVLREGQEYGQLHHRRYH